MKNAEQWLIRLFDKNNKLANQAWKNTFDLSSPDIKYILQDLSVYCNAKKSSFVPNDPYQTAFNEGARDVFLHILSMANLELQEVLEKTEKL